MKKLDLKPETLYIDPDGYLFHTGLEKTGGVGLIKSPGLAEEIYNKLVFSADGELEKYNDTKIQNSSTISALEILNQFGFLCKNSE